MGGRTCVITGATSGIGLATARELAQRGAHLVLVVRDPSRGELVATGLRRETGADVRAVVADLASLTSVRNAVAALQRLERIDVLINNAGGIFALRRESVDGHEMTLALNHLGPFLLTNLLLPRLLGSAPARIVQVSSDAHRDVKRLDLVDIEARDRSYPRSEGASLLYTLAMPWAHPGFQRYAETKLANILFTRELARRLSGTGVTANALHPGLVNTAFTRGNGAFGWFMRRYMSLRGATPDEGARASIHCATSPALAGVTGAYYVDGRATAPSVAARDPEVALRLWEWSARAVGLPAGA